MDRDQPLIQNGEFRSKIEPRLTVLGDSGILRERTAAGWITCDECGSRCRLEYVTDRTTKTASAFASCVNCGVYDVPPIELRRWYVDVERCIKAVFSAAGVTVALKALITDRIWRIGKATWGGRSRELYFIRRYRSDEGHPANLELSRRPKALVFSPTEETAGRISDNVPNLVIALESVVSLHEESIRFDVEYVEGRLLDLELLVSKTGRKPPKKRGTRAANIQKFRDALIEHIIAARDHAKFTKETTGTPKLLKRPTRKHLAEQLGLKPYEFTRCYDDEKATEFRLLWDVAGDLDQIMRYSGSVRPRREFDS